MTKNHGHSVSLHRAGQLLLVKGFTFNYIRQRIRKMASNCIKRQDDYRNGCIRKEIVASCNSHVKESVKVLTEACEIANDRGFINVEVKAAVVHRPRGRTRKRPPVNALNNQTASVAAKCHLKRNGHTNTVFVQKRGRPRKIVTSGLPLISTNVSVATKSTDEAAVARRPRGRPRKRPPVNASLNNQTTFVAAKCHLLRNEHTNSVFVRKRGRPRKIVTGDSSLISTNVSVATKSGDEANEHQHEKAIEVGKADEFEQKDDVCRSFTDADTVVRRQRGRPWKQPTVGGTPLGVGNTLVMSECGVHERCDVNAAVLRRRGQPCKRFLDD